MIGWLKVKNAAKYADVSERTLRTWLKSGLRHSRLPSGTILIKIEWLDEFLEENEVENNNSVEKIAEQVIKNLRK